MKINNKENKLQCSKCGEWKPKVKDFYMSQSKMYENNDKRIPLCKTCLNERYEELYEKYNDEMKAMHHWCINFDVYFSEANFESAFSQAGREGSVSIVGIYMKNANSMKQNKGKTSLQSEIIVNQVEEIKETKINNIYEDYDIEITPYMRKAWIKRWGKGYSDEDYIYLEDTFNEFYEAYPHDTPAEIMLLRNVSTTLLEGEICRRKGEIKGYESMMKLVSSLLSDSNIKPSQKKTMGDKVGECFGVFIENVEKNEPVDSPTGEFEDVDGIGRLIDRQFVKNFAKIFDLGGDDEYADED